ncbi:unnamed protein product [Peronospora belbahrii]|uniref:Uncharacterized protein n=1 Tax=Peronospora belbahrii TaxID=622444 RepID=A0AAU9L9U5_9STRA|nr:unnamed protein product [Peronospora belbahrii]CAH0520986.1 unnamed protein product [Peronospora belbahrii]
MLSLLLKRVISLAPSTRCYSSHTTLWDLFPSTKARTKPEALPYMMNMKDNLEFALERMRLIGGPVALQLIHPSVSRPKKANPCKRPCSHYRRRLKRYGRRFNK